MKKSYFVSLALLLLVVGCNIDTEEIKTLLPPVQPPLKHAKYIEYSVGHNYNDTVKDFTLPDGTRCVVYDGNSQGGITCDWKK